MGETRGAATKAEILGEAKVLEEMGGEWLPAHAAAFCNVSASFLRRSSCPKLLKAMSGITGNHRVTYKPADVRAWNEARTVERCA